MTSHPGYGRFTVYRQAWHRYRTDHSSQGPANGFGLKVPSLV
jgi:hypothetical protein